jgi:hypothetical protein
MQLTPHVLLQLGFRGEGKDTLKRPAYRLIVPPHPKTGNHYHWQIQVVLGDYPETNPNCGIVSLYDPSTKDAHVLTWEKDDGSKTSKKIDHIEWISDGQRGGIKYMTFPERIVPVAHYIDTVEKLNRVYVGLTGNPPLKVKNPDQIKAVAKRRQQKIKNAKERRKK